MPVKLTQEEFINRCKSIYGELYDYSEVNYTWTKGKVIIKCNKHNHKFLQEPDSFMRNHIGCPYCEREKYLVRRSKRLHGDRFDYSTMCIHGEDLTVTCVKHGNIKTNIEAHLKKFGGCIECKNDFEKEQLEKKRKEFIKKASAFHKNKYDYSKVIFKKSNEKVEIICPEHGSFWQAPIKHLSGGCHFCHTSTHYLDSVYVKAPEFVKFFKIEEDSKLYSISSNQKVDVVCPICKKEHKMSVVNLTNRGYRCKFCSDGASVPEKLLLAILIKLNIEYIHQYKPSWSENKIYDFYLPKFNRIIEVHGGYHYFDSTYSKASDVQNNDYFKKCLALKNNIDSYFEINCSKSSYEFLKNNIKQIIKETESLSEEDWIILWSNCHSTNLNLVLEHWNKGYNTTKKLCEKLNMNETKVLKLLNTLSKLGLCDYDGREHKKLGSIQSKKKIYQYDLSGNLINEFPSAKEVNVNSDIKSHMISERARKKSFMPYKNYIWSYEILDIEHFKELN